ncbi:SsgA family sporulation/cell division regulator [Streptomyces sp. NPDC057411]|uniref:SsgA family sporulation/cell division regulator n=1 Tax=unclassified Streptomyces TaxID=2593676 RepID=UPI0036428F78
MPQPPVAPLPAPRALVQPMAMDLFTSDVAIRIDTTVGYESRDPYALSIAFHLLGEEPVVWRVDRGMILAGALGPTGDGEVRIRPTPDGGLLLQLGPVGQCAVVRCEQEALGRFVRDTFVLVPQGTEERHIDWAPLLASLGH